MSLNHNVNEQTPIEQLSEEMTYHSYIMRNLSMRRFFGELSVPGYIMLTMAENNGSAYLKDIASELKLSMPQVSKIAGTLRDKGYAKWTHDGDGKDGTYIMTTDLGKKVIAHREQAAKGFYTKVIDKFGKENFIRFLNMMHDFETAMEETERSKTGES